MRIGIIGHHGAPIATPFTGGLEAMTWYMARWLANRGHAVTLFAAPGSHVPGVEVVELDLRPTLSALARRDVSMPPRRFIDAHYAYQRLMGELITGRRRFDLVHAHSLHYLPIALGEMLQTPMVLTLHSPPTPWLESALQTSRRRPWLVAVSEASARTWGICDAVIPNGIDLDAWPAGAGGQDLVWSGRLVPEKAPHLAIDAARRAGRSLRLAGPILDREYFAAELAPRLREGDDVRHLGHLDHGALGSLLATSGALLTTPVWEEPFGLTAAEAMATGTPVVGFDRGGVAEVVGTRGGVLVGPGDVPGLARAIAVSDSMSRPAVRAHAHATLGIDQAGEAYLRLYDRALAGASRREFEVDDDASAGVGV